KHLDTARKPELTLFGYSFQGITKNINNDRPDAPDIDILRHCFTAPSERPLMMYLFAKIVTIRGGIIIISAFAAISQ
ncbi:hypothetical protein LCGC14_3044230, partial [marine sediment metagenome]